jgi:AcrR family transcriptional regulator
MADDGAACNAAGASGDGSGRPPGRADRRMTRGDQTRLAIVEATVELIRSGTPLPSAEQVACRAGVSVRSVHHHFHRRNELFRTATELQAGSFRSTIGAVPPRGPVEVRVRAVCRQRRLLFEAVAPVIWASEFWSRHFGDDQPAVTEYRLRLRRQLAYAFGPEIADCGDAGPLLLDALETATGWQAWHAARSGCGRNATDSERVMAFTMACLLAGPGFGLLGGPASGRPDRPRSRLPG